MLVLSLACSAVSSLPPAPALRRLPALWADMRFLRIVFFRRKSQIHLAWQCGTAMTLVPCLWSELVAAAVTDRLCHHLRSDGYAMLDDALPAAEMGLLRSEALALADTDGGFAQHMFQFGGSRERLMFRKPHIFEADMHDQRLSVWLVHCLNIAIMVLRVHERYSVS